MSLDPRYTDALAFLVSHLLIVKQLNFNAVSTAPCHMMNTVLGLLSVPQNEVASQYMSHNPIKAMYPYTWRHLTMNRFLLFNNLTSTTCVEIFV